MNDNNQDDIQIKGSYAWPKIDSLVQDCRNSIALAVEFLQSCAKPSK